MIVFCMSLRCGVLSFLCDAGWSIMCLYDGLYLLFFIDFVGLLCVLFCYFLVVFCFWCVWFVCGVLRLLVVVSFGLSCVCVFY